MKPFHISRWGSINPTSLKPHLAATHRVFVGASMIGVLLWSFAPHAAFAQKENEYEPFLFEINDFSGLAGWPLPSFPRDYFASTLSGSETLAVIPDPRVEILREYLTTKKSPLADHAETLLKQYHYRLIIGISFAESNFCKRNIRPHNCWGIGGGNPESYANYDEALKRANDLIEKYHDSGLTTPKLMRNRWVGWQNHNWILAVEQVTHALESQGL